LAQAGQCVGTRVSRPCRHHRQFLGSRYGPSGSSSITCRKLSERRVWRRFRRPTICFRWSRGSAPRLLRLTMDGLLDRTRGATPCIKARQRPKARPTRHNAGELKLRRFCGQNTTTKVSLMSIEFEGEPPFLMTETAGGF
jgi:hypothetical protein